MHLRHIIFTNAQKKKFEIEERVQILLPAELASSFAASHTVPSLPEDQRLHSSPSRVSFWDTQAQNIVAKLSGVPVSTPLVPNSPVHIPVPSSLPMSTPPAPVDPAALAAPAAMTMPELIAAFTTALHSSQPPAAYTGPNSVPAPVSLPPLVQIERPDFYHGARSANAIDGWTGSVESYINTFQDLCMDIPSMTEDEALDRFVSGLRPETRSQVRFQEPLDLAEAARTALAFENGHRPVPTSRPEVVPQYVRDDGPTPMDLDAMEGRGSMRTNYQGRSGQHSN
ncbi:hypothetical protein PHYBLDRAFT_174668 [Phycomyces blakesleeanus NRRL 1555(-)]|uniref:Retrotransposon gag domain-containing protein n=1 Tax=Phycomyces blakesleeanus (strain ATCC 8743b / DSM 1359 / FGSC 10004 / NBRC 33097 / NRRL 1555) TaxID=763407 RepID=A0A167JZ43_PHYB8|nr:hypothetical protein PHYBLDRAFT_174668 [Phycomyces blakesleeanus NRRL 1555(-)]OAD66958.1 hypothetical protein PHYBLDRAFT_174668 [Phycomyces blakesleeanus NRRL 1555(-)]|eukprot:XP_018284998.1 hypothetical protein PHYBLDRAFT_174668 [Phycomyces blakesleeanus NRRL 1555(-)]